MESCGRTSALEPSQYPTSWVNHGWAGEKNTDSFAEIFSTQIYWNPISSWLQEPPTWHRTDSNLNSHDVLVGFFFRRSYSWSKSLYFVVSWLQQDSQLRKVRFASTDREWGYQQFQSLFVNERMTHFVGNYWCFLSREWGNDPFHSYQNDSPSNPQQPPATHPFPAWNTPVLLSGSALQDGTAAHALVATYRTVEALRELMVANQRNP